MRILATLILTAALVFANPANAVRANREENQNAKQTLEIKKINTFNDNFLRAVYAPNVNHLPRSKTAKNQSFSRNLTLPKGNFLANISAYTAAADECGKSDGITASGTKVQANRTLACPKAYKFGTKIEIEGMGIYICEDRGSAIKGNRFDIYMPTKKEAFAFGRRNLIATVIE